MTPDKGIMCDNSIDFMSLVKHKIWVAVKFRRKIITILDLVYT